MSSHGRSSSHAFSRPASLFQSTGLPPAPEQLSRSPLAKSRSRPRTHADEVSSGTSRKRRSDHGLHEETKRRRQDEPFVAAEELLKPPIVVRAHPPNPLSKPYTLLPLMLLPREHLPLSYLDLSAPQGDLPFSHKFQSHIRIMELEGRLGSNILIARSPSSNATSSVGFSSASSIFAIERDETGLYVLCKLGSWVDIRKLSQFATALCRQRMPTSTQEAANVMEPALITPQVYKERGRKRLAIAELQSIVRRRPTSQLVAEMTTQLSQDDETQHVDEPTTAGRANAASDETTSKDVADELSSHAPGPAAAASSILPAKPAPLPTPPGSDATKTSPTAHIQSPPQQTDPPTADSIFQNIRNQYFEALYHSMGSLAYFAKGPLSRARAAFHLDCDSNLEMDELIDFLKGLVLTTAVIDKKYRETVPEIVARLRTLGGYISDETETKRKSKKAKKVKLSSSGLYSDEESHVRKWWDTNKPAPRDDEVFPRPQEVKYTIACLRTRETQLQMILILEILALEAMRPAGEGGESQLPGLPGMPLADLATTPLAKKEAPKKRSKHNFPLLIDVHADRLCIWQSTTLDEMRALAESQVRTAGADEHDTPKGTQSDPLKDFCVDIIVPFFSPRLPLICDALNRKLGGPVIAPPPRSSKKASSSTKSPSDAKSREKSSSSRRKQEQKAKPGAAARRPGTAASNSARSLERVLSNERLRRSVSRGPNDAIAQMRSATAAPIPGLKREMSEPAALSSIPSHRRGSSTSLKDRPSNNLARSASAIGISTDASSKRTEDPRARKRAMVEAELQEAISALKKPNRELAGKAAVEAAEKRLFAAASHIRKPKKPARPTADSPVQVKATPVNNRFRDVFAAEATAVESQRAAAFGDYHSQHQNHHSYPLPTDREQHSPARLDEYGLSGIAATPVAGRIQATPSRAVPVVPDSAMRATTMTTTVTTTTLLTAGKFAMARKAIQPSPADDEASFAPASRHIPKENRAFALDNDVVLASSPLQARSRPSTKAAPLAETRANAVPLPPTRAPPSPILGRVSRAVLFETPTKVRPLSMDSGDRSGETIEGIAVANPPLPPARSVADDGGGSIQSLYQQMGWDDDLDDLV